MSSVVKTGPAAAEATRNPSPRAGPPRAARACARAISIPQVPREANAERSVTHWTRILYCDILADADPVPTLRMRTWQILALAWATMRSIACAAPRGVARRLRDRHRRRRDARATCRLLRNLDDRALRDLGFSRDEVESVAWEVYGLVDNTRMRPPTRDGDHRC